MTVAAAKKIAWVKVQDADGVVQEHEVPAHWVGTDLLPHGFQKAGSKPDADGDAQAEAAAGAKAAEEKAAEEKAAAEKAAAEADAKAKAEAAKS